MKLQVVPPSVLRPDAELAAGALPQPPLLLPAIDCTWA